jgi:protein gp37
LPNGNWTDTADPDAAPTLTLTDVRQRLVALIRATPNLDWLLLTKRPENVIPALKAVYNLQVTECLRDDCLMAWIDGRRPPANVWLGASIEDQLRADERIPILTEIPAASRFLSIEPLLGPVDLSEYLYPRGQIHWAITGCESGASRRYQSDYENAAGNIIDQCFVANLPVFNKQTPVNGRVSHDPTEWHPRLRVRQFPKVTP